MDAFFVFKTGKCHLSEKLKKESEDVSFGRKLMDKNKHIKICLKILTKWLGGGYNGFKIFGKLCKKTKNVT